MFHAENMNILMPQYEIESMEKCSFFSAAVIDTLTKTNLKKGRIELAYASMSQSVLKGSYIRNPRQRPKAEIMLAGFLPGLCFPII